jgi:tRNA-specific 2-thiouridylase
MIDFDLPKGARLVVAMSGGVDSSVVAALAAEAGYETIGVTLQLYDQGAARARPGACCAGADIRDAARVAAQAGIAHYVLDYESAFRTEVMEDFADAYAAGRTPIPCVRCNQTVKFRDLMKVARDLGADALATGHYVRRVGGELHRAADTSRDQSYFLFATTAEQLAYLRFPLGGLPKAEVRAHAERLGLTVAAKPDSQDICFVPDGDYASVVRRLRPDAAAPGEIVDLAGRVLGQHQGLIHYTVGQRRGLDLGGHADPLYVVRLDPARRRLVVGPASALGVASAALSELNWLAEPIGPEGRAVAVKVRSAAQPVPARLFADGTVRFASPERGVAPGQACVAYDGDRVLGGGWIDATEKAIPEAA